MEFSDADRDSGLRRHTLCGHVRGVIEEELEYLKRFWVELVWLRCELIHLRFQLFVLRLKNLYLRSKLTKLLPKAGVLGETSENVVN